MNNEMGVVVFAVDESIYVVIIVSEGNSHVVLSVLLMHALDPQSCQFNVQPIETPFFFPMFF